MIAFAVLCLLVVVLLWLRKQRGKSVPDPQKQLHKHDYSADIVGKSTFVLSQSLPKATTKSQGEKTEDKTDTFAPAVERKSPAMIPPDEVDALFANYPPEGEQNHSLDVLIYPEEYLPAPESPPEEDDEITERPTVVARGVAFDALTGAVKTVDAPDAATERMRLEAGQVLSEVRRTDMFEQLISRKPERMSTVASLMKQYEDDYYRRCAEAAGETIAPEITAPADFNVSSIV